MKVDRRRREDTANCGIAWLGFGVLSAGAKIDARSGVCSCGLLDEAMSVEQDKAALVTALKEQEKIQSQALQKKIAERRVSL